jgi:hypothetical protein
MKIISLCLLVSVFIGCGIRQPKPVEPQYSTNECKSYHSMSTAPMAPHAVEALRINCEESLKK